MVNKQKPLAVNNEAHAEEPKTAGPFCLRQTADVPETKYKPLNEINKHAKIQVNSVLQKQSSPNLPVPPMTHDVQRFHNIEVQAMLLNQCLANE